LRKKQLERKGAPKEGRSDQLTGCPRMCGRTNQGKAKVSTRVLRIGENGERTARK